MGDKQGSIIPFDFDCRSVGLDKRTLSPIPPEGFMSELVGVEGQLQGGLRPHPGFKMVRNLGLVAPTNASSTAASITNYTWTAGTTKQLTKGSGSRTGTWAAGALIELTDPSATMNRGIYYVQSIASSGDTIQLVRQVNDDPLTGNISNGVNGTRVTFAEFSSVTEFYDLRPFSLQIKGQVAVHGFVCRAKGIIAGATRYQTWIEWYDTLAATWKSTVLEQSTSSTAYGSLDPTSSKLDVVVWGRLMFVFREGWEPILVYATASTSAITMTIDYDTGPGEAPTLNRQGDSGRLGFESVSTLHEIRPNHYGSTSSADYFKTYASPNTLGTSGSAPSADGGGAWYTSAPSKYADMATWDRDARDVTETDKGLLAGNYAFAIQFRNENTGRISALSNVAAQPKARFGTDTHNYFALEIVYDSNKWTHCRIYRSVNSDNAGGTFSNSILIQEAEIRLSEYEPDRTDTATMYSPNTTGTTYGGTPSVLATPLRKAIYWIVQSDQQLVFSPVYNNDAYFDADMPTAGAAIVYDNTLLCSRSRDEPKGLNGIGEIRWSSLTERSLELFPPENRTIPRKGVDTPFAYVEVGDRVLGFSANRMYVIYKASAFMVVRDIHAGYGAVNPRAMCVVGNEVFVITSSGLMSIDVSTSMDGIRALDRVFTVDWKNQRSELGICFDSQTKCVICLRPPADGDYEDHGEAYLLWQTTSMVTQLKHTRFVRCANGVEPGTSDSSERAFLVTDEGALYKPDETRSKTAINTMLEASTATYTDLNLSLADVGVNPPSYSSNALTFKVSGTPTLNSSMVNCVLAFTSGTLAHRAFKVTAIDNTAKTITIAVPSNLASSLATGDDVCINPMLVWVQGGPIGLQDENGQSYGLTNLFRRRRIRTIGVHLLDPANTSSNPNAKFWGTVVRVGTASPLVRSAPTALDGSEYTSVVEGPSTNHASIQRAGALLCPGVQFWVAGLDFQLLGFRALGGVESSEREGFAT